MTKKIKYAKFHGSENESVCSRNFCLFLVGHITKGLLQLFFFFFVFPAVSTSMPQFHRMMGERLRSVEQGADTVVWLALSRAAARTRSGQFFQGEQHQFDRSFRHTQRCNFISYFKLFALQIVGLFLPTCLWPGLTVLQKTFRASGLSWKLLPQLLSHNLNES